MTKELGEKIKRIRIAKGMEQDQFADALDTTQSTVSRWERGSKPGHEFLRKIADFAGVSVDVLLDLGHIKIAKTGQVPVVGYVGAGAAVFPYDDYAHGTGMDYIERPDFVSGTVIAVEVKGDSLFPVAEDGWRLIYAGEQSIIEAEVLNRLCVVQLADGRMMVKRVMRGSEPQRYHLVSTNAPIIEDAEIMWAAKVKAIIPN